MGWILAVFAFGTLHGLFAQATQAPAPAARANDPLFLSNAIPEEYTVNGEKRTRWIPGDKKLAFAWSGQPFAINVPFDVAPLVEDGVVLGNQRYKISIAWRGFGAAKKPLEVDGSVPAILNHGYYRLDGKPIRQDGPAKIFVVTSEGAFPPNLELPRLARQGKRAQALPVHDLTGPSHAVFWIAVDPRKGFDTAAWTGNEALAGSFEATVEGEYSPDTKVTRKVDMRIKQDGWQLTSTTPSWEGELNGKIVEKGGTRYKFADLGQEFKGGALMASHRVVEVADSPDRKPVPTEVMVTVTLPTKIYDFGKEQGSVAVREFTSGGLPEDFHLGLAESSSVVVKAYGYSPGGAGASNPASVPKPRIFDNGPAAFFNAFALGGPDAKTGLHLATWSLDFGPASSLLPQDWTPEKKAQPFRLLSVDLAYATADKGAVRHVNIFATRLSSLEENVAGEVPKESEVQIAATPQREDDGFYAWMVKLNGQRDQTEERVQEIMLELRTQRAQTQAARAKWLHLMRLDMQTFPPETSPRDTLANAAFTAAGNALTGGRGISLRPTLTSAALQELRETREEILTQTTLLHAEQAKLIEEGIRITKMLAEAASMQQIGSREVPDHLKQVNVAVDLFRDRHTLTKLYFYDAAGWYDTDEMRQTINELRFADSATREIAKVMEAKGYLAEAKRSDLKMALALSSPTPVEPQSPAAQAGQTARINAMNSLREVLKLNAGNIEAKAMLQDVELELLDWLPPKLERARGSSMGAFNSYLSQRGYSEKVPQDWWDGMKEYVWVRWSNSPTTLSAGLPWEKVFGQYAGSDKDQPTTTVGQHAATTDIELTAVAKNQISLLAIRRLVRNGMTLQEIRNVSPQELATRMTFHTLERKPLAPDKARRLCTDIHETFAELYDLQALAEGNPEAFQEYLAKNYYPSFNPDKTWPESISDTFFSPGNLILFLGPSAVLRVGTNWLPLSMPASTAALAQGAKVVTVRDTFATVFRLEELGRKITSTKAGAALADAILADQQFLQNRSGLERFLTGGSRLAATMVLYCGAVSVAEDSNIPGLKILVDAIAALGTEEIAYDILSRNGTPLRKLLTKVERFEAVVAAERVEADQLQQAIEKLEALQAKIAAGGPAGTVLPNTAEFKELEAIIARCGPKDGALAVPGAGVKVNGQQALKDAAEALKQGQAAEAARALAGAKKLNKEVLQTLDAYTIAINAARANLQANPALRVIAGTKQFEKMGNVNLPDAILSVDKLPAGPTGEFIKFGDEALRKGNLEEALDLYCHAADLAKGSPEAVAFVEGRLALAAGTKGQAEGLLKVRQTSTANAGAAHAITDAERDRVLQQIQDGTLSFTPLGAHEKGRSPIFAVRDKATNKLLYLVKHEAREPSVAAELIAGLTAEATGVKAPACARFKVPGHMVESEDSTAMEELSGILVRAVEGVEVFQQSPEVIMALKAEYAQQRVLRAWLTDADGHFRNMFVGADGHLWAFDFGWGSIQLDHELRLSRGGLHAGNDRELVRDALNFPEKAVREYGANALYQWIVRVDETLSYDEMAGTVEKIKGLCDKDGGSALRGMLEKCVPKEEVEKTFQNLVDRANYLEKALSDKFPAIDEALRKRIRSSFAPPTPIEVNPFQILQFPERLQLAA